ncbi:MAG: Crp/Fnr family transcriptional regulator [Ruminococcaceae bacterium]|nr:Crp/Fnr family transcriptional regulator [Oscillospiraceae bacterium]
MQQSDFQTLYETVFPFWKYLSPAQQQYLTENSIQTVFRKGRTIHDGNQCTGVIYIRSGSLRLYMLSEDGKEITLCRLFEGEVCILSASCALQSLTFDVFVDAEEDSECAVISGCAFAAVSEEVKEMKIYALESALSRFSDVMWIMQQILFMSFDRRLAIFLIDESAKLGSDTIKLTHEQIAKYMGSAREVVSRMLKYFASEGMVELSRGGVRLTDKKRLRKLAL